MKKVSLFLCISLLVQSLTAQNDDSPHYLRISGNAVIKITDVDFNNNTYYQNYHNNYDMYNQQGYRQFNFTMTPVTVSCGVNVEYEMVNK